MDTKLSQFQSSDAIRWRVTLVSGGLSLLAYGYLAFSSQYYGDATLFELLGVMFTCAALCFVVWFTHFRMQCEVSVPLVLLFAVLFRLIGVTAFPILEDDVYRYLWDGYLTVTTGAPYDQPPIDFFDSDKLAPGFEEILGQINYPGIATIYGPVCQWVFALAYLIAPGEIWPLQLLFALADIGVVLVLLRFAKPNAVLLYAWCPLVVKEFAFTAHPDVLGVFFLMLAIWCFQKKYAIWVGVLIALATGVKVFALLIVPFLFGFNWRSWLAFMATAILVALPFGVYDAWVPQGLKAMGGDWLFNAPLYVFFGTWFSVSLVKTSLLLVLAIGAGGYAMHALKHWPIGIPRGDYLFGALFVCMPAFNPWYLVWLLPFAAIRPSVWAWCASVSVLLAYASGINLQNQALGPYDIPSWVLCIEFGIIAVAIVTHYRLIAGRSDQQKRPGL